MSYYGDYLHQPITVICTDGDRLSGNVISFGGSVQGKEEYGTPEDFLVLDTNGSATILFDSDIQKIVKK